MSKYSFWSPQVLDVLLGDALTETDIIFSTATGQGPGFYIAHSLLRNIQSPTSNRISQVVSPCPDLWVLNFRVLIGIVIAKMAGLPGIPF